MFISRAIKKIQRNKNNAEYKKRNDIHYTHKEIISHSFFKIFV